MNKLIIFVLILFLDIVFAQNHYRDKTELRMQTMDVPADSTNTFKLQKTLGVYYCYPDTASPPIFWDICSDCLPCNDCNGGEVTITGSLSQGNEG